ncbi:MAG TPA: type II toxin-antitoxin system VapC family toxin [Vicinamibacteria bacterium]|nr:type II toxin-antitoxin system VapC family toxin [Vicinamibacteria bacterium]
MKYVLDTNTVSFLMRGDPNVAARLTAHRRTDVSLPQPVVAEIEYGLARLPRSARRKRLRRRFDVLLENLVRANWSDDVSRAFGRIKADLEKRGVPIEDFDVAIASHALSSDAVLVTDNIEHMSRIPRLRLENWTESPIR